MSTNGNAVAVRGEIATALAEPRGVSLLRPIASPAVVLEAQEAARNLVQQALQKDRDYGVVPGTDKPTLLKPGAERVALAFGCYYGDPEIVEREVDHNYAVEYTKTRWETKPKPANWETLKAAGAGRNRKFDNKWVWQERITEEGFSRGLYRYVLRVPVINRATGERVGFGVGAASTMESKYIDRPRDAENTVLKMAHKRAIVGAALVTFGLSDQFTQDIEDAPREPEPEATTTEPAARPEGNRRAGSRQAAENAQAETLTLEAAMALTLPGAPGGTAWGGKGGTALGQLSVEMLESIAAWKPKKPSQLPAAAAMILAQLAAEAPKPTAQPASDDERVANAVAAEQSNQSDLPF